VSKLRSAPAIAHAAAARSCVQQLPGGPRLMIDLRYERALLGDGTARNALVQCALTAVQALSQQPAVTLQLGGLEDAWFAFALAAAEQYSEMAGDAAIAGLCLTCAPNEIQRLMRELACGDAATPVRSRTWRVPAPQQRGPEPADFGD
jgi:hypothetical protein